MKNAIIAVLSFALCFFVLYSLGAFHYGSGIDRNHRAHFVSRRVADVEQAEHWLLGLSLVKDNAISKDVLQGMQCAVDMRNATGGVLNKPFLLETGELGAGQESHRRVVQRFCNLPTAVVYGPPSTLGVPSDRALSQFQGLPCISPMTPSDSFWPALSPDTYISLYPPLELWANSITEAIARCSPSKILLLGTNEGSYGWLYLNSCEQELRHRLPVAEIFRHNYTPPLKGDELRYVLHLYNENRGLDAIVFSGDARDLLTFDLIQRGLKLRIPVYGSDLLDVEAMKDDWLRLSFPLFVPHCEIATPSAAFSRTYVERFGRHPSVWSILGAQSVFLTAQALEANQGYHPDRLVETVRLLVERLWRESPPVIRLDLFNPDAGAS